MAERPEGEGGGGPDGDPRPRVLLKLSGEALAQPGVPGYALDRVEPLLDELVACARADVQLAVVVGGGNVFRGAELAGSRVLRDTADRMGMLATVMNGLCLRDLLRSRGLAVRLLIGHHAFDVAEPFTRDAAVSALAAGEVVILAGGTGQPYFTTDTAAVLRALQIDANRLLKATKVDGVYDHDPARVAEAVRFDRITYTECLDRGLEVVDQTALALARENALSMVVFDMHEPGAIRAAALGEPVGTRIDAE